MSLIQRFADVRTEVNIFIICRNFKFILEPKIIVLCICTNGRHLIPKSWAWLSNISCKEILFQIWFGAKDGRIFIMDPDTRQVVKTLGNAHTDSIRSMCISPNGMVMVGGGGGDGKVTVWSSMAEECTD